MIDGGGPAVKPRMAEAGAARDGGERRLKPRMAEAGAAS